MHPKTFQVRLRKPFGLVTLHPYLFYLHAQDRHAALDWVERVFPGIDTKPTLYRWSGGKVSPIGNSDPVSIIDCDAFTKSRRVSGKLLRSAAEPGEFRHSLSDVADDLEKILAHMREEQNRHFESFFAMARDYERSPRAWQYERLEEIKLAVENATLWGDNLRVEYERIRPRRVLAMPPMLHAQAA